MLQERATAAAAEASELRHALQTASVKLDVRLAALHHRFPRAFHSLKESFCQ